MIDDQTLEAQLEHTLDETHWPKLGALYRGKVRDVYRTEERLVMITTDRVSAFDHVLGTIPFKGEILNAIAADGFEATKDVLPNHLLATPDPNVFVVKVVSAYPIELVVRAYITGSLWRDYLSGKADAYGLDLPRGLEKDERLPQPILTPSTKAAHGAHDEPISKKEIVARGLMTARDLEEAEAAAFALFARGSEIAEKRGLILVDTKYELGKDRDGRLTAIDEIHTPDSSRYWIRASYERRFAAGAAQEMLDKENLRDWLIKVHGFSGHGTPPQLDKTIRISLARFYAELYERLLGRAFAPSVGPLAPRIEANLNRAGLL
jgi:phosphoribosylaminoimidazole-succinocarboxamide synthase